MNRIEKSRQGTLAYNTGIAAEDTVERDYRARGAAIIARRWRRKEGEIDLIVRLANVLVFVEVKARRSFELAAETFTPHKWHRLEATAQRFLTESGLGPSVEARFDAAMVNSQGQTRIVENAYIG